MSLVSQFKAKLTEKKRASQRGQLKLNSVVGLGLTTLLIAIVAIILTAFQADTSVTANGSAYNAIGDALTMITNVTTRLGLVGTMIGFGLVILAALVIFAVSRRTGEGL